MMRFPSKAKLVQLQKFNDFNPLGIGVLINVISWTLDLLAVGKLHTVWVQFGKVPECFKLLCGTCETATALGSVLEIYMNTITHEKIRA